MKQSFSPYLGGPVFITSDSLLNGFHVLLEDSFRACELSRATELARNFEQILERAGKAVAANQRPELVDAWQHAQKVLGPALVLLGTSIQVFDPVVRSEVETQVARIRAAEEVSLPAWLQPATAQLPAIDYRRCRPVGFYDSDPKLADYFRAVRWLQMVSFRVDRDRELAAITIIGGSVTYDQANGFFAQYAALLGTTAGHGLPEARYSCQGGLIGFELARPWPEALKWKRSMFAMMLESGDEAGLYDFDETPPDFAERIARIQFRLLPPYEFPDTKLFQRIADGGEDPDSRVVAAMLGSALAQSSLSPAATTAIEALTKEAATARRAPRGRGGRVLYHEYIEALKAQFLPPPPDAPHFMSTAVWQAKSTQTALAGWAQLRHTFTLQASVSQNYFCVTDTPPGFVEPNPEFFSRMGDVVDQARSLLGGVERERWELLSTITRKLEALAHKQLRGQPWTASEDDFLREYGPNLAHIMGYYGNSYIAPQDDAPRCAEVHRNLVRDTGITVGVGRPRQIYVLYPWNGVEILCTGSVMTFYEAERRERSTDSEWKGWLDANQISQPAWLLESLEGRTSAAPQGSEAMRGAAAAESAAPSTGSSPL